MSYVLWCPEHQMVVDMAPSRTLLGTGITHRKEYSCLSDFQSKEVSP